MSLSAGIPLMMQQSGLMAQALPALSASGRLMQHASNAHCLASSRPTLPHLRRFAAEPARAADDSSSGRAETPSKPSASALFTDGAVSPHAGLKRDMQPEEWSMSHPVYETKYLLRVKPTHLKPTELHQRIGYSLIQALRWSFDKATGYSSAPGAMNEAKWLQRFIFLETVAGVPGMVAGMLRHLKSLRSMRRDNGWIHTLLEEAENERMHLLTFFEMRQPGPLFRAMVILTQGIFFNLYFIGYLLSPKTCHAAIGFLEEEAVKTYTHALEEIEAGRLWKDAPAPQIGVDYWRLRPGANMRDLILAVRADEACHSHVNHTFSKLKNDQVNPFAAGASQLP